MRLRHRFLAYFVVAAVASCALTVGVGVLLVRHQIANQRMSALEAEANDIAAVGGAPGALGPGDHVYRVGTRRPRRLNRFAAAAVLASLPAGAAHGTAIVDGVSIIYATRPTNVGRVVLIRSAKLAFGEWRPFLWSLLLAGLGGVLLAAALSFLLARRLARPIGELSVATRRLAAGEPRVAVPVRGEDELADLGTAFNRMSGELERVREAHRQFLESVSHELKTPLTSIRGYAEAIDEDAVAAGDGAKVIAAEADRLERLVVDLLELARFGRADFSVQHEPVDLVDVAEQAARRHRPLAQEQSVELRTDTTPTAWALGDPDRLMQATSNLIENALRLTPPHGSVTVGAAPGQISVSDTGPGLAPEDIPHAFERFYLHDRYRSERPVGSGLGLAIVEQLIVAMGGTVEAASEPENGARFTLRLPGPPRLEGDVRTQQMGLDQAQEGDRRRAPGPAVHEIDSRDHGRSPRGRW